MTSTGIAPLLPAGCPLIVGVVNITEDSFSDGGRYLDPAAGAAWLNDIQGFGDSGMYPALAAGEGRLVVMHCVQAAGPATRVLTDPAAVWSGIKRFFTQRLAALQAAGISRDRLIIDPGLGYFLGRTPEPSLAALAGIRDLKDAFGVPVLVSASRKSFLRALTGRAIGQSGPATLAAEIFAAWQGADYIRTHDVAALHDALTLLAAITGQARQA